MRFPAFDLRAPYLRALLSVISLLAAACGTAGVEPSAAKRFAATVGECERVPEVLREELPECTNDSDCSEFCGTYCDQFAGRCTFDCMVPPELEGEACEAGKVCNDLGKCADGGGGGGLPSEPEPEQAELELSPGALQVGTAPVPLTASLVFRADSAVVPDHVLTSQVRVAASEGFEVRCPGDAAFGPECAIDSWTFETLGEGPFRADNEIMVRRLSSGEDKENMVRAALEGTAREVFVPLFEPNGGLDGQYAGAMTSPSFDEPLLITAVVRGPYLIVRDVTKTLSESGTLILDTVVDQNGLGTKRYARWLSATDQKQPAAAAAYRATSSVELDGESLVSSFSIEHEGGAFASNWSLAIARINDEVISCESDASCNHAHVCPSSLGVCVPELDWSGAEPDDGEIVDVRGDGWWSHLLPELNKRSVTAFYGELGGRLVERMLCAVSQTDDSILSTELAGSISGELLCQGASLGAVAMVTHTDRNAPENVPVLLERCIRELESRPQGSAWPDLAGNRGVCANLARFYPALRALAAEEQFVPSLDTDPRSRGLLVMLLKNWVQLQGFLASASLAERGYDDFFAEDRDDARERLTQVLDLIDEGWTALLDDRVAPQVEKAATWTDDYRVTRAPAVYFPLDGSGQDVLSQRYLRFRGGFDNPDCHSFPSNGLAQGFNCSGFEIYIGPKNDENLSISFNILKDDNVGYGGYNGGTVVFTETMGIVFEPQGNFFGKGVVLGTNVGVVHPVEGGGVEWVFFNLNPEKWWLGVDAFDNYTIVRNAEDKTYTVHARRRADGKDVEFTKNYSKRIGGRLPRTQSGRMLVTPSYLPDLHPDPDSLSPRTRLDDLTVWNTALSANEAASLADARATSSGRTSWPTDTRIIDSESQEFDTALATLTDEAQVAHFNLLERYIDELRADADLRCAGIVGDEDVVADGLERVGHAVRQSLELEAMLPSVGTYVPGSNDRASSARALVRAKRSALIRKGQGLLNCSDPYGLSANQVPLYFKLGKLEKEDEAFTAASLFLKKETNEAVIAAKNAHDEAKAAWLSQKDAKLQDQLTDSQREERVHQLELRYGETLRRLCGIDDLPADEVFRAFQNGSQNIDTCFVKPLARCNDTFSKPLSEMDPTCLRGSIGVAITQASAAQTDFLAAYSDWESAGRDASTAARLCINKQIDHFGCDAAEGYEDIECPDDHEGTLQLTYDYLEFMKKKDKQRSLLGNIVKVVTTAAIFIGSAVLAPATGGGSLAVFSAWVAYGGAIAAFPMSDLENSAKARKRQYEAMLRHRAAVDDIRTCWTTAVQLEGRITSAEERSASALSRMQSNSISLQNQLGDLRHAALEGPLQVARERELTRVRFSFHYWLGEKIEQYDHKLKRAKRYLYFWLRAAEYETQQSFRKPSTGNPSSGEILAAWNPAQLDTQQDRLEDAINSTYLDRKTSRRWQTIDIAEDVIGIKRDELPGYLSNSLRSIYDKEGRLLGKGVKFSYLPADNLITPLKVCSERVWTVNLAAPISDDGDPVDFKVYKRNTFSSRLCGEEGKLQVASYAPTANLFVDSGERAIDTVYANKSYSSATVKVTNLEETQQGAFFQSESYTDGAAGDFGGMGLYGDYIILIPQRLLDFGAVELAQLTQLAIRFDYMSIEEPEDPSPLNIELDTSNEPLILN